MKLNKKIKVNGREYSIISDVVLLEFMSPGRGIIVIKSEKPVYGKVQYYLGYNGKYVLYFTGYVKESTQVDEKQHRLLILENSAVLENRLPLSLRYAETEKILFEVSRQTGLEFITEKSDWNSVIIPCVYNTGSGFALMNFLQRELRITNPVHIQYGDGKIYFGSWDGSKFGGVLLQLPVNIVESVSVKGGTLPVIPAYRPGIKLKIGTNECFYIVKVEVSGAKMRLNWVKDPWG